MRKERESGNKSGKGMDREMERKDVTKFVE